MYENLGLTLRRRRKELGLTQNAVAKALNVTRSAVGQWESGAHEPSTENLIAISQYYSINIDDLIAGNYAQTILIRFQEIIAAPKSDERSAALQEFNTGAAHIIDLLTQDMPTRLPVRMSFPNIGTEYSIMFSAISFYTPCPRKLVGHKEVYCIVINGNRLEPKFESGQIVYVDPTAKIKKGDFVVYRKDTIIGENDDQGRDPAPGDYFIIGRFFSLTETELLIERFSPRDHCRVALTDGAKIERVCDPSELIEFDLGK